MIQAIPTKFRGWHFRSRLEARWCVFFQNAGVDFTYEPEGFQLPSGKYMPDFEIRGVGLRGATENLWIEIKPAEPPEEEQQLYRELAIASGQPLILLKSPHVHNGDDFYHRQYAPTVDGGVWEDEPVHFCKCFKCGRIKIEFSESSYFTCPACGNPCRPDHLDLVLAMAKANQHRFGGRW